MLFFGGGRHQAKNAQNYLNFIKHFTLLRWLIGPKIIQICSKKKVGAIENAMQRA
jgi:hypothetical protein